MLLSVYMKTRHLGSLLGILFPRTREANCWDPIPVPYSPLLFNFPLHVGQHKTVDLLYLFSTRVAVSTGSWNVDHEDW
jgi:hypothetical protein